MNKESEIEYFSYMENLIVKSRQENINEAIQILGTMIDEAINLLNVNGLKNAINIGETLLSENQKELSDYTYSILNYYLGVAYSEMITMDKGFKIKGLEKGIYHYRIALDSDEIDTQHKSSILVNLANSMSAVGRNFDSLRYINEALEYDSNHPIALGNKARILNSIADSIYDDGHKNLLYASIFDCYRKALSNKELPEYAKIPYSKIYNNLEPYAEDFNMLINENHSNELIIEENKNRQYRKWCLRHQLFLNPLNSIMDNNLSARDVFGLPSIVTKVGDGPYYHSMYNNIKQEYVSSRYLFYKGLNREGTHFSDKEVSIYNTLDYASQSYNNECVKAGFRIVYSLLDKIAYFINIYYEINLPYHKVNFRSIWSEKIKNKFQLRSNLRSDKNWAVNALIWLSKELHEKDIYTGDLSVFSRKVPTLRNYIEHKHLKILDMDIGSRYFTEPEGYAMTIARNDFIDNTMFLFKIVRDAIMYLSIAVNIEEYYRNTQRKEQIIPPMSITNIEDDWKR
ncbi:MAG: LA2681 family HEPN domain-containing protein [Vallitalea sp.]|jgi:hypothetical protein|nr:LA2681 family HEPN domain-containing protein [Vallitalea sp.]